MLLSALDRGEQPRKALRLLQEASLRRQRLSEVSFGSCASGCSRIALWRPALALLEGTAQRALGSDMTCNAVLMACSRASSWRLDGLVG